jgi:hypothetical protein
LSIRKLTLLVEDGVTVAVAVNEPPKGILDDKRASEVVEAGRLSVRLSMLTGADDPA